MYWKMRGDIFNSNIIKKNELFKKKKKLKEFVEKEKSLFWEKEASRLLLLFPLSLLPISFTI